MTVSDNYYYSFQGIDWVTIIIATSVQVIIYHMYLLLPLLLLIIWEFNMFVFKSFKFKTIEIITIEFKTSEFNFSDQKYCIQNINLIRNFWIQDFENILENIDLL